VPTHPRNADGQTAYAVAKANNRAEVVALLPIDEPEPEPTPPPAEPVPEPVAKPVEVKAPAPEKKKDPLPLLIDAARMGKLFSPSFVCLFVDFDLMVFASVQVIWRL
jgi:hypothetical protein